MDQRLIIFRFMLPISASNKNKKGISIIEILLAISILSIAFIALLGVGAYSLRISSLLERTELANSLVQEAIEATRSFRGGTTWATNGLGAITTGISHPHYPVLNMGTNPSSWTLPEGTQTINGFSRKMVFDNVSRDPTTSAIENVYNPTHNDPDTKKLTVSVFWGSQKVEVIIYLTNWKQ